jgi:hypothetical protein
MAPSARRIMGTHRDQDVRVDDVESVLQRLAGVEWPGDDEPSEAAARRCAIPRQRRE